MAGLRGPGEHGLARVEPVVAEQVPDEDGGEGGAGYALRGQRIDVAQRARGARRGGERAVAQGPESGDVTAEQEHRHLGRAEQAQKVAHHVLHRERVAGVLDRHRDRNAVGVELTGQVVDRVALGEPACGQGKHGDDRPALQRRDPQDAAEGVPVVRFEVAGVGERDQPEFLLPSAPGGADAASAVDAARARVAVGVAEDRAVESFFAESVGDGVRRGARDDQAGVVRGGDLGGRVGLGRGAVDEEPSPELIQRAVHRSTVTMIRRRVIGLHADAERHRTNGAQACPAAAGVWSRRWRRRA